MIAKHIPMQVVKKSNFSGLVNYIVSSQSKQERVGEVTVTNCYSDDPLDAALEIEAKQALNRRSQSDKTYHLILSFVPHEAVAPDVLKAVEARICEGLGFGEHQRVSAVHHDTDHLHIHIAINKIHPTRLTNVTPYYDHKILGQVCEQLEREYGLVQTNHQAHQRGAASRGVDMEHAAGIESLLGWIRRECAEKIKGATTWAALHQVLRAHGLDIQERGVGFVFSDQSGIRVKASSVARDFAKKRLEEKLGAFERVATVANAQVHTPLHYYQEQPLPSRMNTIELYARYREEQQHHYSARSQAWQQMRERKNRRREGIQRQYRLKRATIKLMVGDSASKKILYRLAYNTFKEDMEKTRQEYANERQIIYAQYTRRAWVDWLQHKAGEGDTEALCALRARQTSPQVSNSTVAGKKVQSSTAMPGMSLDSITKKGTIIYRVGASAIRDDGEVLNLSRGITQEGLVAALRMAKHRYGERLIVNGSDPFKEQIVHAAEVAKLGVTFDNAILETRRQELSSLLNVNTLEQRAERREISDYMHAAAEHYIAEREEKRLAGIDIPKHVHYNGVVDVTVIFTGIRHIHDQSLALLKHDQEIMVLPINEKMEKKLKKLSIGDTLTIGRGGVIKIKGRGRKR